MERMVHMCVCMAYIYSISLPPSFQHEGAVGKRETNFTKPHSCRTSIYARFWIHDYCLEQKHNEILYFISLSRSIQPQYT